MPKIYELISYLVIVAYAAGNDSPFLQNHGCYVKDYLSFVANWDYVQTDL